MERQVLNNPLTEIQTTLAARVNMFFVARETILQHALDGAQNLPAGRWVMIIQRRRKHTNDEYLCQDLIVAAPGVYDPEGKLNGARRLYSKRGFRLLVVPIGKELEYFRKVATSARLFHKAIGNEELSPARKKRLPARRRRAKSP